MLDDSPSQNLQLWFQTLFFHPPSTIAWVIPTNMFTSLNLPLPGHVCMHLSYKTLGNLKLGFSWQRCKPTLRTTSTCALLPASPRQLKRTRRADKNLNLMLPAVPWVTKSFVSPRCLMFRHSWNCSKLTCWLARLKSQTLHSSYHSVLSSFSPSAIDWSPGASALHRRPSVTEWTCLSSLILYHSPPHMVLYSWSTAVHSSPISTSSSVSSHLSSCCPFCLNPLLVSPTTLPLFQFPNPRLNSEPLLWVPRAPWEQLNHILVIFAECSLCTLRPLRPWVIWTRRQCLLHLHISSTSFNASTSGCSVNTCWTDRNWNKLNGCISPTALNSHFAGKKNNPFHLYS